jgi:hypothetical protein
MYVMAIFEQTAFIELSLTEIEQLGISRERILAVPMEKRVEKRKIFDTIHHADGISLFDGAAALGTALMVIGAIYGFILKWGPIVWGLIGLLTGAAIGFLLDCLIGKRRVFNRKIERVPEVVVIVQCDSPNQMEAVETALWDHYALGVAKYRQEGS